MSTESTLQDRIERAAATVGSAWPLHSFVTANPLAGFEDQPFAEAVQEGAKFFGGRGYPSVEVFRTALERGQIDRELLVEGLTDHGYEADPETLLDRMAETDTACEQSGTEETPTDRVDQLLTKWLSAFLDQGRADWPMPNREEGFYAAFRTVAQYDRELPNRDELATLPAEPLEAIDQHLEAHSADRYEALFEYHLAALPGWTGFIKRHAADGGDWQSAAPITLVDYLAVRLILTELLDAPIAPPESASSDSAHAEKDGQQPLPELWLTAWEATYRQELVEAVSASAETRTTAETGSRPAAQLVFCIDTRSEIIRRHIETAGDYETHGYAGFFGIPMRYQGYDTESTVDACPPVLDAQHRIEDWPTNEHEDVRAEYDRLTGLLDAGRGLVKGLKSNAATAFSFVESAGSGYGLALTARTLVPGAVYDLFDTADSRIPDDHEFCSPTVNHDPTAEDELPLGLTLEEKVEYAATAFELMGWTEFARVVVFAGHTSQTTNNPFDSSLDCGACAGNPGGPSARVLATICNDTEVKERLRERGIEIPDDTVFVAGEHNTTTDEVSLFTSTVPESHAEDIDQLQADLEEARAGATAERAEAMAAEDTAGVRETERRAADWAETRPEWGLAGNAAFVIGPRALTSDLDLDGRSFLHSYDWQTDPEGDALEGILTGPMVVTQWINCQYYFATVDTAVYGSGSKITQNPVGNVGVYQGNGGDLLTGLPLQSLMSADDEPYHQPLRLSTVIHAPVDRVTEILAEHEHLRELLDNDWLALTVVDPTEDNDAFHYEEQLRWRRRDTETPAKRAEPVAPTPTADD
jgi:hypothetical protein